MMELWKFNMAAKTKKVPPQETPSERFERIAEKVLARQRRADESRASREREAANYATR